MRVYSAVMESFAKEARKLASSLPGFSADINIHCKPCLSLRYGDICLGRCPSTHPTVEELAAKFGGGTFTGARLNPQGQLCLSLNRPITFRRCIQQILEGRPDRGGCHGDTTPQKPIIVVDYITGCRVSVNEVELAGAPQKLSVGEGRIILLKKVLHHNLTITGHRTTAERQPTQNCSGAPEAVRTPQGSLVGKFFNSFPSFPLSTLPPPTLTKEGFLREIESSTYVSRSPHGSVWDAKIIEEKSLRAYDSNIRTVTVRGEDGTMTGAGSLAWSLCVTNTRLAGEDSVAGRVLHVTGHSDNFRLQQALVLVKVYSETQSQTTVLPSQHIILCSDVEVCEEDGRVSKDYPLETLLRKRQRQMIEAFRIKYDTKTLSEVDVQGLVSATTEAVVKFELLSTDPQSKLRLTVPGDTSQCSDARFAGSFVLYNYARLANLVKNFEKACKLGKYPPLPDNMSTIDFSLLTDEEEWYILFHHLLQFPLIVRELLSSCVRQSQDLRCHVKLNKVCQFLTKLSHSVSTYYSRVKILMAPEPHLTPLIHARLLLIMAIKQTMYSALRLLAIEPPEQL